jgi:Mg2+/Co2+ transporter CorC
MENKEDSELTPTNDTSKSLLSMLLSNLFAKEETLREKLFDFFAQNGIEITNDQGQMMLGVVRMLGLDASKVKIPLNKMTMISADSNMSGAKTIIVKSGHSRIPVYEEIDNKKKFFGILYAKDVLKGNNTKKEKFDLAKLCRKAALVPDSQSLLSLLREMRDRKTHIALTVNEFGDVTGLVTLEDILEIIVGDIHDEYDNEKDPVKEIDLHTYKVDASIRLEDVNRRLSLNLPEERFNTLGGFLMHELKGELFENANILHGNVQIILGRFKGQQIDNVIVKILKTIDSP